MIDVLIHVSHSITNHPYIPGATEHPLLHLHHDRRFTPPNSCRRLFCVLSILRHPHHLLIGKPLPLSSRHPTAVPAQAVLHALDTAPQTMLPAPSIAHPALEAAPYTL